MTKQVPIINKVTAILAVFIFLAPVIFKGGDTVMRIHDQLDSYNVYEVLVDSGKTFSTGEGVIIENIMNGLPRDCFPSGYNIVLWLIMIFGAKSGFFINYLLVHLIGFIGMLLLLNRVINKGDKHNFNWLIAAAFGILPVNSLAGISLMGIPLVFYAFNNLHNKHKTAEALVIVLFYCLYSSLIHAGVFVLMFLGIIFLYQLIKKKASLHYFTGMLVMAIIFSLIEVNLIKSILFSNIYISHRQEFTRGLSLNLNGVLGVGFLNVIKGNYGSANYFGLPILLMAVGSIVYGIIARLAVKKILLTLIIIFSIGTFVSLLDWKCMDVVYAKFHILEAFNLRRLHFLLPVLMFVLLAHCINFITEKKQVLILPLSLFCACIISFNFHLNIEYNKNPDDMTFNGFFSKSLFKSVGEFINVPKSTFRVVSIGIEPTVAQCNGFYTLDSYQNNYSLDYKKSFRKIIAGELEKYPEDKKYFDNWGNRCTIPYHPGQNADGENVISNLSINTKEFKDLGGTFIFSAAHIGNADSLGLKKVNVFTDAESPYKIYLYAVL